MPVWSGIIGAPRYDFNFLTTDNATSLANKGFVFARSGSAQDFSYTTVATDVPRIDTSRGFLLEGPRTNCALQSDNLNSSFWTKSFCTLSLDRSGPNGGSTADAMIANAVTNTVRILRSSAPTNAVGPEMCFSTYMKYLGGGFNWVRLGMAGNVTANAQSWFDLSAGVVGHTNTLWDVDIENVGSSWYRPWIARSLTGETVIDFRISPSSADNSTANITGDGTTLIYDIWQMQVEDGGFPSAPIQTAASPLTRNAETCIKTINPISSKLVMFKFLTPLGVTNGLDQTIYRCDDGTDNNMVRFLRNVSRELRCIITVSGTDVANINLGTTADKTVIKAGFMFQEGSVYGFMNGGSLVSSIGGGVTAPICTRECLGHGGSTVTPANWSFAHIQKAKKYTVLPTSVMQSLINAL